MDSFSRVNLFTGSIPAPASHSTLGFDGRCRDPSIAQVRLIRSPPGELTLTGFVYVAASLARSIAAPRLN